MSQSQINCYSQIVSLKCCSTLTYQEIYITIHYFWRNNILTDTNHYKNEFILLQFSCYKIMKVHVNRVFLLLLYSMKAMHSITMLCGKSYVQKYAVFYWEKFLCCNQKGSISATNLQPFSQSRCSFSGDGDG